MEVMKEINSLTLDSQQNRTLSLAEILLSSCPRVIEHSADLTYTHAEFSVSNRTTLVFDINSASYQLAYGHNETLNPFEVKFKLIET